MSNKALFRGIASGAMKSWLEAPEMKAMRAKMEAETLQAQERAKLLKSQAASAGLDLANKPTEIEHKNAIDSALEITRTAQADLAKKQNENYNPEVEKAIREANKDLMKANAESALYRSKEAGERFKGLSERIRIEKEIKALNLAQAKINATANKIKNDPETVTKLRDFAVKLAKLHNELEQARIDKIKKDAGDSKDGKTGSGDSSATDYLKIPVNRMPDGAWEYTKKSMFQYMREQGYNIPTDALFVEMNKEDAKAVNDTLRSARTMRAKTDAKGNVIMHYDKKADKTIVDMEPSGTRVVDDFFESYAKTMVNRHNDPAILEKFMTQGAFYNMGVSPTLVDKYFPTAKAEAEAIKNRAIKAKQSKAKASQLAKRLADSNPDLDKALAMYDENYHAAEQEGKTMSFSYNMGAAAIKDEYNYRNTKIPSFSIEPQAEGTSNSKPAEPKNYVEMASGNQATAKQEPAKSNESNVETELKQKQDAINNANKSVEKAETELALKNTAKSAFESQVMVDFTREYNDLIRGWGVTEEDVSKYVKYLMVKKDSKDEGTVGEQYGYNEEEIQALIDKLWAEVKSRQSVESSGE